MWDEFLMVDYVRRHLQKPVSNFLRLSFIMGWEALPNFKKKNFFKAISSKAYCYDLEAQKLKNSFFLLWSRIYAIWGK